jgi:hypothetical protein
MFLDVCLTRLSHSAHHHLPQKWKIPPLGYVMGQIREALFTPKHSGCCLHHCNAGLWGGAMTTSFYDGQRYELVRTEPYTRTDGGKATLSVWRSICPVCGEPFETRRPSRARKFAPNRRCEELKRSGVRVNRRNKHASRSWLARRPPDRKKNFPRQRRSSAGYARNTRWRQALVHKRTIGVICAGINGAL